MYLPCFANFFYDDVMYLEIHNLKRVGGSLPSQIFIFAEI